MIRLFGSRQERRTRQGETEQTWINRAAILSRLVDDLEFDRVWPELVVRNVHVFHAVVAAFTAYFWALEGWRGPEDLLPAKDAPSPISGALSEAISSLGSRWLEDGWIWVPPSRVSE